MKKLRKYHGKDVYMLIAVKTILLSLQKYLSELSAVRTNWTVEFVTALIARVDMAMEKYLGLDVKKTLRMAKSNASAVFTPARRDLSAIRTQLMVDFKNVPDKLTEIIKSLGLPKTLKKIKNSNQETLINHLYAFKKGMTEELKAEIVAKGTNPAIIERLVNFASQLSEASLAKEFEKESSEELSSEALAEFNGIYLEIIGICKIASNFYLDEPLKKAQFSYSHVLNNMITVHKKNGDDQTDGDAAPENTDDKK